MEEKITEQVDNVLDELSQLQAEIFKVADDTIKINGQIYYLVEDYREGFDLDSFKDLYDEYFEKFDFIVGDWGYDKLRLRGFYQLNQKRVPQDQTIGFLDDYIKEYCNFGCSYFVIGKDSSVEEYQDLVDQEEVQAPLADFTKGRYGGVTTKKRSSKSRRRRQRESRQKNQPKFTKKSSQTKTKTTTNKKSTNNQQAKSDGEFVIHRNK